MEKLNIMLTSKEISNLINDYIAHLPYDRKPKSLYEPIQYVLSIGGKRLRPTLMLLVYNMFRDHPEKIVSTACGLETYHNYTLLHDDLMDDADLRRGHETVHKRWNANAAILSGDTMLVMAYRFMAECCKEKLCQVLDLFTETALEIGEGQQFDMEFESRNDVTEDEYIEMIRLKTSVLIACAMKMGAILADAPSQDAENLYHFGEQIGLAFQLQDDYLDVYGDPEVFGKAIGGDILCNKKTYMLINALNLADERQREELEKWIAATAPDPKEKIESVTRLYNEIGIRELAEKAISHYFLQAKQFIDAVGVAEDRKIELKKYIEQLMKRQY